VGDETDQLFRASLAGYSAPNKRPWRLDSQFWAAFFGGPAAAGALAWVNAGRLRLSPARRIAVLSIAAGALVLEAVAAAVLAVADIASAIGESDWRVLGLTVQGGGAVAHPFLHGVQRTGDRIFRLVCEEADYVSLWRPGLVAVVGGGPIGIAVAWVAANEAEP
jgi:hypothetical protein